MSYKSISVRKLYMISAVLVVSYIVLSVLSYCFSDLVVNLFASDSFKEMHPEMKISVLNKLQLCGFGLIIWIPYLKYITGCMELGFSEKRCRKTFKAAPLLWLLGFIGEHAFVCFKAAAGSLKNEGMMIQKAEYATFFFGILVVASLVIACTSAALGLDEIRHVDHMKQLK